MAEPNNLPSKPPITNIPLDHVCPGGYSTDNNNFHFRGNFYKLLRSSWLYYLNLMK